MKKYLFTLALTALAASPALAASHSRVNNSEAANAAYGYVASDADTVVSNGQIIGQDPDAIIREDLLRQGNQAEVSGN